MYTCVGRQLVTPTSPWRSWQTRDILLAQLPLRRGSRRNGIWAKGDVTGLLRTCRGRHGEVGIVEFGLYQCYQCCQYLLCRCFYLMTTSFAEKQQWSALLEAVTSSNKNSNKIADASVFGNVMFHMSSHGDGHMDVMCTWPLSDQVSYLSVHFDSALL